MATRKKVKAKKKSTIRKTSARMPRGDAGTKGTGSAGRRPEGGDAGTKGTGSAGRKRRT